MILKSLSVRRDSASWYTDTVDHAAPFMATIEVSGRSGKVELRLDAELSRRIVEIVADEVAKAGRATAEMMTAEAFEMVAPAAKAKALSA